ncbi:hypothetical protein SLS63_003034 [Diaporthe eres]|uniref:NAD(P)-binding domain-containing protein n=1 Tax=Diaporthe eres TaxID=83184 RepID=A0ABR1PI42_DIAER
MKVGVEDAIKALDFEHAIILRPGAILGEREKPKNKMFEDLMGSLHKISQGLQDSFGQDQKFIGRAAVAAARAAEEGKAPSKFWCVEQAEILKLGRDEWKE